MRLTQVCGVVCLLMMLAWVRGFNLAPKAATVIGEPYKQDNYFGFTVNLQRRTDEGRGTTYWLIVGAPKTNASSSHQRVVETGAVYQCDLADVTCSSIALDDTANEEGISPIRKKSYKHMHNHSWVGGAVAVQDHPRGKIVVCGPRTKWLYKIYDDAYLINGLFYLKTYPFESSDNAKKYIPLYNITNQLYTPPGETKGKFLFTHGQSGFSAHFSKDGSDMLVGAPGVKSWTGTVIRYRNLGASNETVIIPLPGKIPQLEEFAYFGYAVSSGKFLSASSNTYYVGGAPRAGLMTGKVLVFKFEEKKSDNVNVLIELEGFQMGEYFGSSVCVVDLNGDGLDDLVVGAPQHSREDAGFAQSGGDAGRVYVFINEDNGILREIGDRNRIMGSQTKHSRFGTTIANTGDLNWDGYNDIAVGAPYEDSGRGAIYIYHGRSSGIQHKYSQRITAAEIHTSLSGFGISISRGMDVDGNYYNDLAVGAFHSGHAVLIHSQPVVAVRTSISSDVSNLGLNATRFVAVACLSYSGKHAPATAGLLVTLEVVSHDKKARFAPKGDSGNGSATYQYYRLLNNNKAHCDSVPVEIRKGKAEDYTRPIELHLRFKLDHRHQPFIPIRKKRLAALHKDGNSSFCSTCPVLDPRYKPKSSWTVPYAHDCEDDVCKTDLNVKVDFVDSKPPFVLGAQPKLSLRVLVSNRGEQAFLVKLNVTVPRETPLSRLPTMCQEVTESEKEGGSILECDMGSVLAAGEQKEFNLEVKMGELPARITSLRYTFNVTSVGEEQAYQDNFYDMIIPIQTIADVSIQGTSSQDKRNHTKNNQVFYHTYDIRNYGPSPADVLRLKFLIPVSARGLPGDKNFLRVFKPSAYFDNQPITCTPVSGHSFDVDERKTDVDDVENAHEELGLIRKRSIDIALTSSGKKSNVYLDTNPHSDTSLLPANRTLVANCTGPDFDCMVVHCDAGPFKTTQNRAVISFRLVADFVKIEPITGKKDIVVISSLGEVRLLNLPDAVQPPDGRPDEISVNSVFFGNLPEEGVNSLLLALCIAVGILILFLIVGALAKMGFFSRSKRNDLNELLEEECGGRLVEDDKDSENDLQDVNLESTTQKLKTLEVENDFT